MGMILDCTPQRIDETVGELAFLHIGQATTMRTSPHQVEEHLQG